MLDQLLDEIHRRHRVDGCGGVCVGGRRAWTQVMPSAPDARLLYITGTIRRLELEGGLWVVRDGAGTHFNPTNLPAAFERDGLAVEVEARRA